MTRRASRKGRLNRVGRRRLYRRVALAALPLLLLGALLFFLQDRGMMPAGEGAEQWYEASSRPPALVQLPRDDGPHDSEMEWWYYNGHLEARDGRRFGFHYVIFAINRLAGHLVGHASLVDLNAGEHYTAELRTGGKPGSTGEAPFRFELGGWTLVGGGGRDRLAVKASDFVLDLRLESRQPAVMHGGDGLLDLAAAGESYYYSRPRMRATGRAGPAGAVAPVTGIAWFDHQWGPFRVTALAWDWFALQLDDGRDLMIFELFTPAGELVDRVGTVSGGPAGTVPLSGEDFLVEATGEWKSPETGITYPMGWRIDVPAHGLSLEVAPVTTAAEFDGRLSAYLIYWEGPVTVAGSHGGRGYVELMGYEREGVEVSR